MLMETATSAHAEPPIHSLVSNTLMFNIPHRYSVSTEYVWIRDLAEKSQLLLCSTLRIREQTKLLHGDLYRNPSEQMWNNQPHI